MFRFLELGTLILSKSQLEPIDSQNRTVRLPFFDEPTTLCIYPTASFGLLWRTTLSKLLNDGFLAENRMGENGR